ncbi:vitamin K epoxide reductase complex subunit 1 [Aplysia californica]|uniref:vitamin-K-epoxide reductase (warfarin-sensitive) n=1 Tax=Aplysia californica TaxID=6500 RepID=A0ABM0JCB3_APLCA|nr:vitamin K epoxide reductase complex subunit 1 [Aplysia californica]
MESVREAYLISSNLTDQLLLNLMGVVICLYSLQIELRKERNPEYRAYCDINERMSCSKVLTSKYSQGFGVVHLLLGKNHMLNARNCNVGLVVYVLNIMLCIMGPGPLTSRLLYYGALIMVLGCVYLACVLFFILHDVCLVCITTYVINGCLLYLAHSTYSKLYQ